MSEYFFKPKLFERNVKVELDSSSYATKSDLKNVAAVDTWHFAKVADLASLKSDVCKLENKKTKK